MDVARPLLVISDLTYFPSPIGGIFGVASIMTMVVIGYDRYNVIVKGFKGTKITFGKAALILLFVWIYAVLGCTPPFMGWGGYALGKSNQAQCAPDVFNLDQKFQRRNPCF